MDIGSSVKNEVRVQKKSPAWRRLSCSKPLTLILWVNVYFIHDIYTPNMPSFRTLLVSGKTVQVPIEAGTTLTLTNISLDINKKKKGSVVVNAKSASSESTIIGTVSSAAGKSSADVSITFDETNSPVVLFITGNGQVTVTGTQQAVAPPAKKAKTSKKAATKTDEVKTVPQAPVVVETAQEAATKKDNQSYKKRKAAALDDAAAEKESEEPQQINLRKFWKVKPQNDEGVLVSKVKPVFRLKGLKCTDYVIGNGEIPGPGSAVKITYTGLLPDGTVFDSRLKRLAPFVFRKGVNQVVKGLDLGIEGMKVGGSREISVPPELG